MKKEFKATQDYIITSKGTGLVLELAEGSKEDGAAVQLWEATEAKQQRWLIKQTKQGTYQILSKASGKCLDAMAGGTEDGTWIHQWAFVEGTNQLWTIEKVEEGVYKIKNADKCLDIIGMNNEKKNKTKH